MKDLQIAHRAWVDREFLGQPPEVPAAGCVEEAGELLHAALAMERERKWGKDPRHTNLEHDMEDAIGDCAIYCCSFCNAVGWDFADLVSGAAPGRPGPLLKLAVSLVHVASNAAQPPYSKNLFSAYLSSLKAVCAAAGKDFAACTRSTWERVRQRDRTKPKPRVVCLCGSTRFIEAFRKAEFEETLAGRIVLTIGCDTKSEGELFSGDGGAAIKERLDELHKRKINLAQEILVVNPRVNLCDRCGRPAQLGAPGTACCGASSRQGSYIGDSTRGEIAYAILHGKHVRYLCAPG